MLIEKFNTTNSNNGYNLETGGKRGVSSNAAKENRRNKLKGVKQYDKNLNLIKIWNSAPDASEKLGISVASIHECCKKIRKSVKGFIWLYEDDDDLSNIKQSYIIQYSKDGNKIAEYCSAKDASFITGVTISTIYDCCRGDKKSGGGYIWRRANDPLTKEHLEWCNSRKNAEKIVQYSLNNRVIKVWNSISEIQKDSNLSLYHIYLCLRGKIDLAEGCIWRYYEDVKSELN